MHANRTAIVQLAERPTCFVCRDKGWFYAGDDRSLPSCRSCHCTGRPAEMSGFWGHIPIEEPAGDVDDDGRFFNDAA